MNPLLKVLEKMFSNFFMFLLFIFGIAIMINEIVEAVKSL